MFISEGGNQREDGSNVKRNPPSTDAEFIDRVGELFDAVPPEGQAEAEEVLRDVGLDPDAVADRLLKFARAQRAMWDAAIEAAAKIAESQAAEPECPERAQYCADAIRKLSSRG